MRYPGLLLADKIRDWHRYPRPDSSEGILRPFNFLRPSSFDWRNSMSRIRRQTRIGRSDELPPSRHCEIIWGNNRENEKCETERLRGASPLNPWLITSIVTPTFSLEGNVGLTIIRSIHILTKYVFAEITLIFRTEKLLFKCNSLSVALPVFILENKSLLLSLLVNWMSCYNFFFLFLSSFGNIIFIIYFFTHILYIYMCKVTMKVTIIFFIIIIQSI